MRCGVGGELGDEEWGPFRGRRGRGETMKMTLAMDYYREKRFSVFGLDFLMFLINSIKLRKIITEKNALAYSVWTFS